MTYPFIEYIATAGQSDFDVAFPFLSRTHVEVLVNGVLTGIADWTTQSRLRIDPPATAGAVVQIRRNTPIDGPLVQFQNGAVLTKEDLNTAILQVLYRQQELQALYDNSLRKAVLRLGENLGIVTDPDAVIAELANLVLEDQLFDDLRARFADIEANALALLEAGNAIQTVDARVALLGVPDGNGAWLIDTNTVKVSATETLGQRLTQTAARLGDAESAVLSVQEALATFEGGSVSDLSILFTRVAQAEADIVTERNARVTAVSAEASERQVLEARVASTEEGVEDVNARVASEETVRASETTALASRTEALEADVGQFETDLVNEAAARAAGDSAEVTQRYLLQAQLLKKERQQDFRETFVGPTLQDVADASGLIFGSNASLVDLLGGRKALRLNGRDNEIYTSRLLGFDPDTTYGTAVTVENVGTQRAVVYGGFRTFTADGTPFFQTDAGVFHYPVYFFLNPGERKTVRGYSKGLAAVAAGNAVGTQAPDPAFPSPIGEGAAFLSPLILVYPDPYGPTQTVQVNVELIHLYAAEEAAQNRARILGEQTARVTALSAVTSDIALLTTRVGGAESSVGSLQSSVTEITGDLNNLQVTVETTAETAQLLESRIGDAEATIGQLNSTTVSLTQNVGGLAQLTSILDGNLSGLSGTVSGLSGTVGVLSGTVSGLSGDVAGLNGTVGGLSGTVSGLSGTVGDLGGRVTALAESITSLQTSVGDNTASVSQLLSSINGLQARYGISLDVNGFVTGFIQNNSGVGSSSFVVVANRFALVDPGNGVTEPVVPFEISGGVTRIREALIGTLQVEKILSGNLFANIGLQGDINVGTGRIIWDNGVYMKVSGVGFGTSNQFIEWFGPRRAISACNEDDAISYLKTDGSAYFGGSLSAGVLRNAAQSTVVGASAVAEVGPFGSNGGQRTVVMSFAYFRNQIILDAIAFTGTVGVNAILERSFDGVTWVQLTTLSLGGSISGNDGFGPGETGNILTTINGSTTFVDNSGGASVRYRARVANLYLPSITSNILRTDALQQSLSVVSTEQ